MGISRRDVFLILMWLVVAQVPRVQGVESRTKSLSFTEQHRFSKVFATLGVSCKCCDGKEGVCRSTWESSCSKLECLPWEFN
ncbi:hypothetical protein ACHQM5_020059 [Ranunculus cassubicifolius]